MTEGAASRTLRATRAVVADPPGHPATLILYDDRGALCSIMLGPAEAVALASDLLLTARARLGRLGDGAAIESWRALVSLGGLPALDQPELANANQRLAGAVLEASGPDTWARAPLKMLRAGGAR